MSAGAVGAGPGGAGGPGGGTPPAEVPAVAGANGAKQQFYRDFLDTWTICSTQCGACFAHGPIVPHNFLELPPVEWSPPLEKCPSYEHFKFRAYTPVGRGDLAADINDDPHHRPSDGEMKLLYTCLGCGMCSEICYKLRPLTANLAIRDELFKRGAKRPAPLAQIEADVEALGNSFGAKKLPASVEGVPRAGADLYFAGCVARYQKQDSIKATTAILRKAGLEVAYLAQDERCCGLIPGNDGNTALLERRAAENIEAFVRAGAKRVITSCAHCYKTLKVDYPLIAGELPFEVVHVAELFAQLLDEGTIAFAPQPAGGTAEKITYQDPCFLGRYCHELDEPRRVLSRMPGVDLVEMEPNGRWSQCCGSGTKITARCYPELASAVAQKRLGQATAAAPTLVTACTTCSEHLDRAARDGQVDLKVYDLPVAVAKAMGIELE
jgi:Fe-S oxidoreductase